MDDDDRLLRIDQILTRLAQAYAGASHPGGFWPHIDMLGHELFDQVIAQYGKGMPIEVALPMFAISERARSRILRGNAALIAWETATIKDCLEAIWE